MLWRLRFLGGVFRGVTRRRSWAPSAATPGPTGENKAQVTPRYCPATPVVSRLWVLRLMKRIGDTECLLSVPPNRIESQKECARGWPSGPRGAWCWCCCCCCGGPGVSALRLGAGCQLATIGLPPQSPAHHPNALVLVLMALLLPLSCCGGRTHLPWPSWARRSARSRVQREAASALPWLCAVRPALRNLPGQEAALRQRRGRV